LPLLSENIHRDVGGTERQLQAGELTAIWVPDATHEAVRDLVRAREVAAEDLRRKRQQLLSSLLRHGRRFTGVGTGAKLMRAGWPGWPSNIPPS
jgi:transposase